jgi:hypothetical protein
MQNLTSRWPPGKVNQVLFFLFLVNLILLISANTYQSFKKKFCKYINQKEKK